MGSKLNKATGFMRAFGNINLNSSLIAKILQKISLRVL